MGETNSQQERQRKLPSHLVVSLVIPMSLWSSVTITNSPQK
nr:transposase domain-containing protein [Scytonema sp. HK-05]